MAVATKRQGRTHLGFVLGLLCVGGLLFASLAVGEYNILSHDDGWQMFSAVRVPRTIALVLAGASMALAGLMMQLITQNRFAEPTTTGTTEWAGLGLLLCLVFFPSSSILLKMCLAVVTSFVGTLVFFGLLSRVSLRSSLLVPVLGIMLGAVVSAVSTFIALKANALQQLGIWFQGSFTSVYKGQYEVLWVVVVVFIAIAFLADRLTVASLGEEVATSVGVNYRATVFAATGLIALATGVVTVVVGSLPFIGLVVPNIVSMIRGDDMRSNVAWVCLFGVGLVTACDLVARTLIAPFEVPVSVILGIIGAVVFLALIVSRSRRTGAVS